MSLCRRTVVVYLFSLFVNKSNMHSTFKESYNFVVNKTKHKDLMCMELIKDLWVVYFVINTEDY